jgi:hypothetical protein
MGPRNFAKYGSSELCRPYMYFAHFTRDRKVP